MRAAITKLQALCRRWGGDLVLIPRDSYDNLFYTERKDSIFPKLRHRRMREAPFASWHGLHWEAKLVFATHEAAEVGPIIHEMGHVFAVPAYPGDEWHFLGWEALVARQIGAYETWSKENWNYGTNDGDEWGTLSRKQQQELLVERIADGKKLGIINRLGRPVAVR